MELRQKVDNLTEGRIGKITIAPEVLLTIVRLTALNVPGVAHLCSRWRGGVGRFLTSSRLAEGIQINIHDDSVRVEVHIVVYPNDDLLSLARAIQREVARAIHDMVGMSVEEVSVHVEDILFPTTES